MADLEWFASFSAIPGIEWQRPSEVAVGPPWSTARPVVEALGGGESDFTLVRWVDEHGDPLPDGSYWSPAEIAGRSAWQARSTSEVVRAAVTALSLPGTRRDYFDALEHATSALWPIDDEDPHRASWIEHFAWLGIALLRVDLEHAVIPPFTDPKARTAYLAAAAQPYWTLIRLYQREGFLREAAAVFVELGRLPEAARERAHVADDPQEVIVALEELRDAEGLAP